MDLLQFMLPSSIWMSSQESVAYNQSPKSDNCISKTVLDLFSFCFFLFVYWFRCSLSFIYIIIKSFRFKKNQTYSSGSLGLYSP